MFSTKQKYIPIFKPKDYEKKKNWVYETTIQVLRRKWVYETSGKELNWSRRQCPKKKTEQFPSLTRHLNLF